MSVSKTISFPACVAAHPLPWRVCYRQRFDSWHPKSMPHIVDASGALVVSMPTRTHHPGEYDAISDLAAITIVDCVNAYSGKERCPECGYTADDCREQGDHELCERFPFFEFEKPHECVFLPTVGGRLACKCGCWL